jgi:membrane protein
MRLIATTVRNFVRHQDTDQAAALTYYAVFAIFPALLALASLLAVVGDAATVQRTVLDLLRPLVSHQTLSDITPTVRKLTEVKGAPVTLALGGLAALWSASGYVNAFARAMNDVRELEETRPFWRMRPLMLLITFVAVILNALALAIVVVSGPVTDSIAAKVGIGSQSRHIYEIGKWPVLALVVVIVVGMLYRATPNEEMGFRLITLGAFVALVIAMVASAGFAFYVTHFSSYNKTYGSIAGVVVALLWLWLTNVALLFGAELDAARDQDRALRHATMAAMPGPVDLSAAVDVVVEPPADLEALMAPVRIPPPRTESFPHEVGVPVYGPVVQPVPDED